MARSLSISLLLVLLSSWAVSAQDAQQFRQREAEISRYKLWLDDVKSDNYRMWVRLDSKVRPHRLYVGEGFYKADKRAQEEFVDTFSRYLSGHPDKFMLIDLYDAKTGQQIGEFGWGGFKLYSTNNGSPIAAQSNQGK